MKKLMTICSIVLAAGLIITANAQAYPKKDCPHKGKSQTKIEKLKDKAHFYLSNKKDIGLTDEQLDKLASIKKEAVKKLIKLQSDVDITAVDVKSAMWQSTIDVKAVNKLIDKKYGAKKELAKVYVKAIADIKDVLTDEQKAKAKDVYLSWEGKKSKVCPLGKDCAKCRKGECPHKHDGSKCEKCKKGKDCPFMKKEGFTCPKCGYKSKVCPKSMGSDSMKGSGPEKKGS